MKTGNKIKTAAKRCLALTLAAGLVFAGSYSVKADSCNYPKRELTRGDSLKLSPSVTKTNKTGSSGVVTMNVPILNTDTLDFYVKNARDKVVTEGGAVRFRGTKSGATKYIPYKDGKGKKGNKFYPVVALEIGSASIKIDVSCIFIP